MLHCQTYLIVDVELVGMAALNDETQQVSLSVESHTFQLPGLVACALVAVKAKIAKAFHDTLLWISCARWQGANM